MVRLAGVFFFLATGLIVASAGRVPRTPWQQARDCTLGYGSSVRGSYYPFLVNGQGAPRLVYPKGRNGAQMITLPSNSNVLVACPGARNTLRIAPHQQDLSVTCRDSQLFRNDNGQPVQWNDLRCTEKLMPEVQKTGQCFGGYDNYEIRWTSRSGFIIPQITTCYDSQRQAAVYSKHAIDGRHIASRRKAGKEGNRCFRLDGTEDVGGRAYQDGNDKLRRRNINLHPKKGFEKGHLAPYADFVMEAEQEATNYYINAAPQWYLRNTGSWKDVETAVRDRADSLQHTFDVYTGTNGTLEHQGSELYMKETEKKLPIPELFWKVVHDRDTDRCVSFVAFNGIDYNTQRKRGPKVPKISTTTTPPPPFTRNPPCTNICNQLDSWTQIHKFSDTDKTICCSVDDLFRNKKIPDVLPCHGAPLLH